MRDKTRRNVIVAAVLVLALVVVAAVLVVRRGAGSSGAAGSSEGAPAGGSTESPASVRAPATGTFGQVAVGGGGFVTGLSFSDDGATRLIRTDTGGGYRWDAKANRWQLDVSASTLPAADVHPGLGLSVLAVAVAPSDASRSYLAYANRVYRSDDGARTWKRVLSGVSTAANDDFRALGPRLAVDPADPDVVFYGSQLQGMYVTRDGGSSWSRVPTSVLPAGIRIDVSDPATRGSIRRRTNTSRNGAGNRRAPHLASAGISSVVFDPKGPVVDGRSQVLYAASYGEGVYRSADGGRSWSRSSPAAVRSVRAMRVLGNGDLLVTSHRDPTRSRGHSQVWRYDGRSWSMTGPARAANWMKLAADPTTPGRVAMLATNARLALSDDYGRTWSVVRRRTQTSQGDVPWLAWALNGGTRFMSDGDLLFDPVRKGRLWFGEGTGVWYTDLAEDETKPDRVLWHSRSRGIENLSPNDVVVPPGGKPLLAAWDRPIFRSEDPRVYPAGYGPVNRFGAAWSLDYSVSDPDYVVASVASQHPPSDPSTSGFSTDGGKTWRPFPTIPDASKNAMTTFGFGSVAVSDPGNVVWVPAYGKRPQFTTDGGRTWRPITLPGVVSYSLVDAKPYFVDRHVIAADKTTPGTFYLFVLGTGTYRSTDGGRSWQLRSDDHAMAGTDYGFAVRLKAVPGHAGELYLTPGKLNGTTAQPFLHSTDAGKTWTPVRGLTGVTAFGFGKAFAGGDHPVIYAGGYLDGAYGFYRSTDDAGSWTLLTRYPGGRPTAVKAVDGDPDRAGRVYVAMAGGGWVYADTTS